MVKKLTLGVNPAARYLVPLCETLLMGVTKSLARQVYLDKAGVQIAGNLGVDKK